jgi:GT2 family glycosyltransferase
MRQESSSASLWVVIVNWNGGDLSAEALRHVEAGTRRPEGVVLVDNGSRDDSVALAQAVRPDLRLIRNDENRGFAAAANQGMRLAIEEGAANLFLLNPDSRVEADCLAALEAATERHPRGGLFGGKIYFEGEGRRLWCAGVKVGFHANLQKLRGFGEVDEGRFDTEEIVPALTGCGLLIRRSMLDRIGFFDERFFVYVEDLDLCLRAADRGWSSVYVPGARLHHQAGAATGGGYGAWRKEQLAYNLVALVRKRQSYGLCFALLVIDFMPWPLLFLVNLFRGRGRATLAKGRGLLRGLYGFAAPSPPNPS